MNQNVRIRFAPSPTGFLHVGGARTAIFNWLFARNNGGKFLLRIEDTDLRRSKSELSEQIIRSMEWLDLRPDELILYQSDRIDRYREVVNELVLKGKAYYCFETADEIERKRKEAAINKIPYKYDRSSLKLDKLTIEKFLKEKKEFTVRFLIPEGETTFDDLVHGQTVFINSEIDDFVILRSDGSPTYHIAVVIDDHDMKISHVIRGDDHLSNTPKQILLYEALGWDVPVFAHLPMILDESKKKLSKRRNTVSVEDYKENGYLPEALFNFLTLLGYAPENNREIITREELIKIFSFERVNKKSAVFDMNKLRWINSEYIKMKNEDELCILINLRLLKIGLKEQRSEYLKKVITLMKERVSTINDFTDFGRYFFEDPISYDEKGIAKYYNEQTAKYLREYTDELNSISDFSPQELEKNLRSFSERHNIKAAKIIHPLRLALTGITVSPGIFELMEVLGRECVLRRTENLLNSKQITVKIL